MPSAKNENKPEREDALRSGSVVEEQSQDTPDASNSLVSFIAQVAGEDHLKVEENLGDGFVRLRTAEAERRQAKHDIRGVEDIVIEMLRNARDAGANRIFLATTRDEEKQARYLTFIDNGSGIPAHLHRMIFEPRVTSKLESMVMDRWGVHGRGMALYSISMNTRRAFVVTSEPGLGSALFVDVDLTRLSEKRDQSSWPEAKRNDEGKLAIVRGPHNIIRNVLEFSLEQLGVEVYLGTPTEIANVLFHVGKSEMSDSELLFCDDVNSLPVQYRLAAAGGAEELMNIATSVGLPISLRTAHRIVAEDLAPIRPALSKLVPQKAEPAEVDVTRDRRGLKIDRGDINDFSLEMERAFESLAQKYYLSLKEMPKVTVSKDCIHVRFDVEKED